MNTTQFLFGQNRKSNYKFYPLFNFDEIFTDSSKGDDKNDLYAIGYEKIEFYVMKKRDWHREETRNSNFASNQYIDYHDLFFKSNEHFEKLITELEKELIKLIFEN